MDEKRIIELFIASVIISIGLLIFNLIRDTKIEELLIPTHLIYVIMMFLAMFVLFYFGLDIILGGRAREVIK